jgi:hypothetical protein
VQVKSVRKKSSLSEDDEPYRKKARNSVLHNVAQSYQRRYFKVFTLT